MSFELKENVDGDVELVHDTSGDSLIVDSLSTDDATITNWRQPTIFTVWEDSGTIYAMDANGTVQYSGSSAATVIQSALDGIKDHTDTGGSVKVMPGDYTLSSQVTFKHNSIAEYDASQTPLQLIGDGWSTRFRMADGANLDPMFAIEIPSGTAHNSGVMDCYLSGNKANNTSGSGIKPVTGGGGAIRECRFRYILGVEFAGAVFDTDAVPGMDNPMGHKLLAEFSEGTYGMVWTGKLTQALIKSNANNGLKLTSNEAQAAEIDSRGHDGYGINLDTNTVCTGYSGLNNGGATENKDASINGNAFLSGRISAGDSYCIGMRGGTFVGDLSGWTFAPVAWINDGVVNGMGKKSLAGSAPDATNWFTGNIVMDMDNAGDAYLIYDPTSAGGATQIGT